VFPVRYEQKFYILLRRNSVFKGLRTIRIAGQVTSVRKTRNMDQVLKENFKGQQ
jgi:hypothetical protein